MTSMRAMNGVCQPKNHTMACLRSVLGPKRHHARNHLRLPCNTKAAEEEGEPQAHAQRQVGWHKPGEHRVLSAQAGVQATKSTDLTKRHPAEHDGPDDRHTGLAASVQIEARMPPT